MNASTNIFIDVSEILNYEIFLTSIGSSWIIDSCYLFVIAPLGLLAFFSNLISFLVFLKAEFQNLGLFSYLRGF